MIAGVGAFAYASQVAARRTPGADALTVVLENGTCRPNELTVPAGRTTFRIENRTERAVEWEILDGVMVVEERENIAPGLSQTLSARLRPGEYAITCGLLSNPRGRLVVTPAADGAAPSAPDLVAFIAPLAEYRVFTQLQARDLAREVGALDEAIRAGDLAKARGLYSQARAPYLRLAPVASRIADLANAIDPVAAYLGGREADRGFTGFHRLEYGLFAQNATQGLAPISEKLVADVAALRERLRALKLSPADMTDGAARVLQLLADTTAGNGVDAYSRTDLDDFDAGLSGVAKIVALLKPVASDAAPEAFEAVGTRLSTVEAQLAALRGADGYPAFDAVPAESREALAEDTRALGEAVERMGEAIGLSQGGA
ncbi:iron uptake system protein EfeO [Aureimonas flava]|nr:iron uptake system protein EfeO [Aureimonas flava]